MNIDSRWDMWAACSCYYYIRTLLLCYYTLTHPLKMIAAVVVVVKDKYTYHKVSLTFNRYLSCSDCI